MSLLHRRGSARAGIDDGRPPLLRIACLDPTGATTARLRTIAGVEVVADLVAPRQDLVAAVPANVDAAVVALTAADDERVLAIRRLHRVRPGLRIVVIAENTRWFDDAFDAGADAWIATSADDHTLRCALLGSA